MSSRSGCDVLVAGTASDSHTWNLIFLQLFCEERGHRVVNLGPCVPDALLVAETTALCPELVVLSSVNGHGFTDGLTAITALRPRAPRPRVVLGGKLGVDGRRHADRTDALLRAGFDAVFDDGDLTAFDAFLRLPQAVAS